MHDRAKARVAFMAAHNEKLVPEIADDLRLFTIICSSYTVSFQIVV